MFDTCPHIFLKVAIRYFLTPHTYTYTQMHISETVCLCAITHLVRQSGYSQLHKHANVLILLLSVSML